MKQTDLHQDPANPVFVFFANWRRLGQRPNNCPALLYASTAGIFCLVRFTSKRDIRRYTCRKYNKTCKKREKQTPHTQNLRFESFLYDERHQLSPSFLRHCLKMVGANGLEPLTLSV
jgi:hypothetical protein